MDSKDVFIHNLNTIMKDRKVSRKELAKGLNVPYTTLTDWCTGRIFPRVEKINMIADYFGIKKSDLLEEMIETEDERKSMKKKIMSLLLLLMFFLKCF